ncbi:MAG: radical SAM protein [Bacteroidales bacterium]|nr:radical SAM protein [Bacteroidales bacterium]
MLDHFDRSISYLRISVTDQCNLRCLYCMPPDKDLKFMPAEEILTVEEIRNVVTTLVPYGIRKIRLTGGEPLFRPDIIEIVKAITSVEGINDVGLTTNGMLLHKYAQPLFDAGLKRINISLDTLDAAKFERLTSGGQLPHLLRAIEKAQKIGFSPIKINCVRTEDFSAADRAKLENFCNSNGLQLRFIRQMDLKKGYFWPVEGGEGGDCKICNRIRLTANGYFKPCLFNDRAYSIREEGIESAFLKTIDNKPERGEINSKNRFSNIGG